MDFDPRAFVGLIAATVATSMVALSYAAAYLLGRSRGRRDAERASEQRAVLEGDAYARARLDQVEAALTAMGSSIKRLGDAQRVWVDHQDRAMRRERGESSRRTPA